MKINSSEIGHFQSPCQARAYDRCQEIIEQTRSLISDVVLLDGSSLDRDPEPGRILLQAADVQNISRREPKKFEQLPWGGSAVTMPGEKRTAPPKKLPEAKRLGRPTDQLYILEKNANGTVSFDVATGEVRELELEAPKDTGHSFAYSKKRALWGGGEVETFYRFDNFAKDSYYREKVTLNPQSGTLTFEEKLVDRRSGATYSPKYRTLQEDC